MKLVNVNADYMQVFYNDKKRQNNDKYRCECKELIGKGRCDLFGILVYVNVNVIHHMMLKNI